MAWPSISLPGAGISARVSIDRKYALDAALRDNGGSVFLTFWPSEFSQIRGQYRHTRYGGRQARTNSSCNSVFGTGACVLGCSGAHVLRCSGANG